MRIVFALIWLINGGHESRIPVKVGDFEKYHMCQLQGKMLVNLQAYEGDKFVCVPVNAQWR